MEWTEEDKQRVRDISITSQLGMTPYRKIKISCPLPDHNDHTPSFLINEENGFYCFGCGAKGRGLIDFLTLMGYEFKEIMQEYGKH